MPVEPSSPGAVHESVMAESDGPDGAKSEIAAGGAVSGGVVIVIVLLNADVRPEEEKQILIDSPTEYCIAV